MSEIMARQRDRDRAPIRVPVTFTGALVQRYLAEVRDA
jgi:hypothetical protein